MSSLNSQAYDCKQLEAQMIAKVASVSMQDEDHCLLKVELIQFNPSGLCPLEAEGFVGKNKYLSLVKSVSSFSCPIKAGDNISGIAYSGIVDDAQVYINE